MSALPKESFFCREIRKSLKNREAWYNIVQYGFYLSANKKRKNMEKGKKVSVVDFTAQRDALSGEK